MRVAASRAATSVRLRALDAAEGVLGRREPLVPPRRLNFVGNSDFVETGEEFLRHFREVAGLRSSDRVLDVGCGVGRMARVLVGELRPPHGAYDGFDVSRRGIAWCRRHYRDTPVPFRFAHVDLLHPVYHPTGTLSPAAFRFPYADASFDLVIATSVFTHLLEDVADRYLAEAARVLAPGGRLLATWFLLDPAEPPTRDAIVAFLPTAGAAAVADPDVPEAAVAYPAAWVRDRLASHGFHAEVDVHRGTWTGRPGRSAQDIIVARRP